MADWQPPPPHSPPRNFDRVGAASVSIVNTLTVGARVLWIRNTQLEDGFDVDVFDPMKSDPNRPMRSVASRAR